MTNYSGKEWQALRREFLADAVCHWCRRAKATELDHIIELDRGGTNDPDNLVPACKPCNFSKGPRLLTEWRLPDRVAYGVAHSPKVAAEYERLAVEAA